MKYGKVVCYLESTYLSCMFKNISVLPVMWSAISDILELIDYVLLCVIVFFLFLDANKTGVAHETINNIRRASKAMTEQEARQILGVSEQSSWEEILQVLYLSVSVSVNPPPPPPSLAQFFFLNNSTCGCFPSDVPTWK